MGRKQKKYHYIYKTTCSVTNRYYIGMHSTNNLEDGYLGSGKRLWHSIKYHGKENHTKEILEFCENRKELKKRESEIVNDKLLKEDLCMNLKTGGDGGFLDEEHKQKAIKASRVSFINRLNEDEVFRRGVFEILYNNMKKAHRDGKIKYDTFTGRQHTDETKKKMSEVKKGKGTGNTNSQYGTCWITNGKENKKIKKEEINYYLCGGWYKGRNI